MHKFYKKKVENLSKKRGFVTTSVSFFEFQKKRKEERRKHFFFHPFEKNFLKKNSSNQNRSLFSSQKNEFILSSNEQKILVSDSLFFNYPFEKSRLKSILSWFFEKHGHFQSLKFLEKLKEVGFGSATNAGISLGIDDLKIPNQKVFLLSEAETKAAKDSLLYRNAQITGIERVQRFIYNWNQTNDTLKQEVVRLFETTDFLNPIYMMAFSGARGNMSQVRQLVGMRGLMSDPQGQIIDFPIQSNFREGLTLTEYLISTYGARKGIVDTALRTATAGYLTRRLVDVAQHTIVSNFDCGTMRGIFVFDMKDGKKTLYSFQNRLIGRVVAQTLEICEKRSLQHRKKHIVFRNQEIDAKLAQAISKVTKKAFVRSPLTCENSRFVCQLCYGWSFSQGKLVSVGEAVGIIAAQSIGEPGTQLTMRTFHTGGVFAGGLTDQILAPFDGKIKYFQNIPGTCVRNSLSEIAFFTKMPGSFFVEKIQKEMMKDSKKSLFSSHGEEKNQDKKNFSGGIFQSEIFKIPSYALLFCRNNEFVRKKQVLAQFSSVLKKMQYGKAEQTFSSTFAGEFIFGSVSTQSLLPKPRMHSEDILQEEKMQDFSMFVTPTFSNQRQPKKEESMSNMTGEQILLLEKRSGDCSALELKNDILWKSQNWTTVWIFAGNIFSDSFQTNFDFRKGDFLKKTSVMKRILWAKKNRHKYSLFLTHDSFLKKFGLRSSKKRFYLFAFEKKIKNEKVLKQEKEKNTFLIHTFQQNLKRKNQKENLFFPFLKKDSQFFQKTKNKFSLQKTLQTNFSGSNFSLLFPFSSSKKKAKKYFLNSPFFTLFSFFDFFYKEEKMQKKYKKKQHQFQREKEVNFFPQIEKKNQKISFSFEKSKNFSFFLKKNTKDQSERFFDDFEKMTFGNSSSNQLKKQKYKLKLLFFQFLKKRKTFSSPSFLNLLTFKKKRTEIAFFKMQKRFYRKFSYSHKEGNFSSSPFFKKIDFSKKKKLFSFQKNCLLKKRHQQKGFHLTPMDVSNEKNTKTLLLKKLLLRIPVEKMYYKKFGYLSFFSLFEKNDKKTKSLKNSFQTFSTLKTSELFFNERNNGKREDFFSNGNENFFGKEAPFLSSLFFQNFSAKTAGIFSICFFDENLKKKRLSLFFSENFFQKESKKIDFFDIFQKEIQKNIQTKNLLSFEFCQIFQRASLSFFLEQKKMQKKNSFFLSNFSFTEDFYKNLSETKEKKRLSSDFYEKEISWLPEKNFILSEGKENDFSFLHFSSSSDEKPFLFFVNRQGKKKPFLFSLKEQKGKNKKVFDCFVKVVKCNPSQNHRENFQRKKKQIHQTNFSNFHLSQIHSLRPLRPFRQKFSFFHSFHKFNKKQKKCFQKNLVSLFEKRRKKNKILKEKNLKNFLKVFSSPTPLSFSKNPVSFLQSQKLEEKRQRIQKQEKLQKKLKSRKKKTKIFFFGKKFENQCFTCLPFQTKIKKKEKKLKQETILKEEKLQTSKLHFQINEGWPVFGFSSFLKKNFFENHKKIIKKGYFFEKDFSFEEKNVFSEILIFNQNQSVFFEKQKVLNFGSLNFFCKKYSCLGIFNSLDFSFFLNFFEKMLNKKGEKTSFCVDSRKINKNCRYLSLTSSFECQSVEGNNFENNSTSFSPLLFVVQKKPHSFSFEKNQKKKSKKMQRNRNFQKTFFLFRPFQYKVFENPQNSKKFLRTIHSKCFSRIFLFSCFQLLRKYHSTLLNSQKKQKNFIQKNPISEIDFQSNFENMYFSEKNLSFLSILEEEEKNFKKEFLKNQKIEFHQEKEKNKNTKKKLKKQKNQKKRKQFFFFFKKERERKINFSFFSVQFLPLLLSFSKPSSTLFSNFPTFSLNPFQNTLELFLCEKKSLFFEERFSFGNFKDFVHESFWLNKDTMNFLFSEVSSVQSKKIEEKTNFKERKNSQSWLHSVFQKNQHFYGRTEFRSPYEGELLSMTTHDMSWWTKASEISTLQKFRKLFTIVTKKDMFSVRFPFQEETKNDQTMKKSFQTQFTTNEFEKFEYSLSFLTKKQKEKRKLYEFLFKSVFLKKFSPSFFERKESASSSFENQNKSAENFEISQKTKKISSFQTKYENKIYTFENLTVGFPSSSKPPFLGTFAVYGNNFFGSAIQKAGQILHLNLQSMTLRHGQPYLVSSNGILHFSKIPYMKKNVPLLTLPYQTVQAGDIVQGIPKVEQFFEARTTLQGRVFVSSLPILLKGIFERYKVLLPLEQATRQSFLKIQQIIVDGVQRVYRSQGVSITDKHLEIVVRQMTTKVQILHGGQTSLFPGELVNLDFVERINTFLMVKVRYEPVILGITRASLEVESFLSASSFQQTTKILSFAAISRKKDFLKGLKENLLVGNLIPSGTGYFHLSKKL